MRPPSVDVLARSLTDTGLPHPLLVDAARAAIASGVPDPAAEAARRARATASALLRPVINATGVLLHTNLGRAPMGHTSVAAYRNLEFDLQAGTRGSRSDHAGALLARLCGAESALVVNNGAAAVLLSLAALAGAGGRVAVSRGELVEIGGGFRLPEVFAQSGAELVEVGTTNRTRAADYDLDDLALLLRVHRSNFRMTGFTEQPSVAELVALARAPVVVDLGSGLLDAACDWLAGGPPAWLRDEPAVRQTLDTGAGLVIFSGDKLLGGPQAGILAGDAGLVARCAAHPLYRALRPGGLVLESLQDLALTYLRRDGETIAFWRMACTPVDVLRSRAEALDPAAAAACTSLTGGGTLPGVAIESWGLRLGGDHTAALRAAVPKPVIARVEEGHTVIDLRTVEPDDDALLGVALSPLSPR